jgi:hypothetical protein
MRAVALIEDALGAEADSSAQKAGAHRALEAIVDTVAAATA